MLSISRLVATWPVTLRYCHVTSLSKSSPIFVRSDNLKISPIMIYYRSDVSLNTIVYKKTKTKKQKQKQKQKQKTKNKNKKQKKHTLGWTTVFKASTSGYTHSCQPAPKAACSNIYVLSHLQKYVIFWAGICCNYFVKYVAISMLVT